MKRRALALTILTTCTIACTSVLGVKDVFFAAATDGGEEGDAAPREGSVESDAPSGLDGSNDAADADADADADAGNDSGCAKSCLGGACVDGGCLPTPLASGGLDVTELALDDDYVYFTEAVAHRVSRVPKDGGPATLIASQLSDGGGVYEPLGLAVDDTFVYWANSGYLASTLPGGIARAPRVGGGPIEMLTEKLDHPMGVALVGNILYFTEQNVGRVGAVPKDGGTSKTVGTSLSQPFRIAAAPPRVYWIDYQSGEVHSTAIDAGATSLGAPALWGTAIAASAAHAFWTALTPDPRHGQILRAPHDGGPADWGTAAGGAPTGIATDGAYAYWCTTDVLDDGGPATTGAIFRCAIASQCAPERLATLDDVPFAIAVDGLAIYWSTDSGKVMKLAKP